MADTKISGLAAVTDVQATDEFVLARASTTKKIDASDLATFFAASAVGYVTFTSNVSITATTEATAQQIVALASATFDGTTAYEIAFYSPAWAMSVTNQDLFLILYDGSASLGWIWVGRSASGGNFAKGAISLRFTFTPAAGTRVYSIRGFVSAASTGTIIGGAGGSGAYRPGSVTLRRA